VKRVAEKVAGIYEIDKDFKEKLARYPFVNGY